MKTPQMKGIVEALGLTFNLNTEELNGYIPGIQSIRIENYILSKVEINNDQNSLSEYIVELETLIPGGYTEPDFTEYETVKECNDLPEAIAYIFSKIVEEKAKYLMAITLHGKDKVNEYL